MMAENLTTYLHLVSGKMNLKFQNLSSRMKDGFNDLSNDIVKYDYKEQVEDKVRNLYLKFAAIFENDLSQTHIDDFMRECRKNEPIDVLYTMYKRITKGQSDLNPVWKNLIAAQYDDKVFGPWEKHFRDTTTFMTLCQLMYIACEYKDERTNTQESIDADVKEVELLFSLVNDIKTAVEKLDKERKEVYFDKIIEKVVHDAAYTEDKKKPWDIISENLKSRYVWHDFLVVSWIYVRSDTLGVHDWNVTADERFKYFKKEINGRYYLVVRLASELNNDRSGDLTNLVSTFTSGIISSNDPGPYTVATLLNKDREEPSFAFVLQFRAKFNQGMGDAPKQDLQYTYTKRSKFSYNSSCPEYNGYVSNEVFGNKIPVPVKWNTNRNIFVANSRGPKLDDSSCSIL